MNARFDDARVSELRAIPHSIQSEQGVLGALLLDSRVMGRLKLQPEDFFRREHAAIFEAMCQFDAAGKPFDAIVLGEWFEAQGRGSLVENGALLFDLQASQPGTAMASAHAQVVREKSNLRQMIEISARLSESCFCPDGRSSAEILDEGIRDMMALTKADARHEFSLQDAVRSAWDDTQEAIANPGVLRGVPTGYERMDRRLGGLHRGDLIILGARPSMGKTALMVNLALNAAARDFVVGLISGEQSALQIGQRAMAVESQVPAERMRSGDFEDEHWPRMSDAIRVLKSRRAQIYDRSAPTLEEVCRIARRWVQEHGCQVLYVDYLQRIRSPKAQNRIDEVSDIARGLKTLARDLDIPVVALAQVKAEVDKRPSDKRPGLGDVANSDEATREADLIGFLYRDEVYDENSQRRGIAELNFEKNRHGPTGRFEFRFDAQTMRFLDLARGGF